MCNQHRTDKANAALWEAFQDWREEGQREKERWSEHGRNMPVPFEMFPNRPGRFFHLLPDGQLALSEGIWGMPSPSFVLKGKSYDPGVTNVRNTASPHWRRWLGTQNRCLVPWTSFCEPDQVGGSKKKIWFALADGQEVAWFAGVRDELSRQVRAKDPEPVSGEFYAFLTTEANAEVRQYHDKAMPVILTTLAECRRWLTEPWDQVKDLQRPLPDGSLTVMTAETPAQTDLF